jgi:alpha-tubulin suppressor-like RCC1 family protein
MGGVFGRTALVGLLVVGSGCRAPTQLTLAMSTDSACANLGGTSVTVGHLGEIELKAPTTSSAFCDASGNLGSLVVVPSASKGDEVAVKVVAGVGKSADGCTPPYGKGCIVARRAIRFLPHTALRIAIPLRLSCDGTPCADGETCVAGACVGATIADPSACGTADGCGEEALGPPTGVDGGVDASSSAALAHRLSIAEHSCAITPDGVLKCWGYNGEGELGNGTTTSTTTPAQVATQVLSVAAGEAQTCARRGATGVQCWGSNLVGELGDGTTVARPSPTDVRGVETATQIATGSGVSCALLAAGTIRCWGRNGRGSIGDGTTTDRLSPTDVVSLGGVAVDLALGPMSAHVCAVMASQSVRCWGPNRFGQLGDGTTIDRATPTDVASLGGLATRVAAGGTATCALLTDGRVRCWGANGVGQLGIGTLGEMGPPADVPLDGSATDLSAGATHACAVLASGAVRCWGGNDSGQIGNGRTQAAPSPVAVTTSGPAVRVAAGRFHTCALLASGALQCWGSGGDGSLGDGTVTDHFTPVTVTAFP